MSNMSYCRWQNTSIDLRDCAEDLEERLHGGPDKGDEDGPEVLSAGEQQAMRRTFETMINMFSAIGIDVDSHEVERALGEVK